MTFGLIIGGSMLVGFGSGLIAGHWFAGTIIGLGGGMIIQALAALPMRLLRRMERR